MRLIRYPGMAVFTLFLTFAGCSSEERTSPSLPPIEIRIDPTVELFCIIHRLAETGQDVTNELPGYIEDIRGHFGSFRDHQAVSVAKGLWATHRINLSALSTLVVYLDAPPGLRPRNELDPVPSELDSRWSADVIPAFIAAARDFSRDSDFPAFFNNHKDLYDRAIENLNDCLVDENMLPWFQGYFNYIPGNFSVIIGMQTGWGNYGASTTRRDGTSEFFAILGAHSPFFWSDVPRFSRSEVIPIVVHEFCHPYVNPQVQQHCELLKEAGQRLYRHHQARLAEGGCLQWDHMMNEYMVRACVIRYFYSRNDIKAVNRQIQDDERQGYVGIRRLAEFLKEYEEDRITYRDMDSFFPRIAGYFKQFADSSDSRSKEGF